MPYTPISALPTPPNRSMAQSIFTTTMDAFLAALPTFQSEANVLGAAISSFFSGYPYAIPLTFSTTTADADPGAGKLRLNNATQTSATAAYVDNLSGTGADMTALLDSFDDSTTTVKGMLRLISGNDPTKFLVYAVTGTVVDGTGYRKLTLTYVTGSGANPFANNDAIVLTFARSGDQGIQGNSYIPSADIQTFSASGTWTKPTTSNGVAATPKWILVRALGAGGGGGSGQCAAIGTARGGGSGGGGGSINEVWLPASVAGVTETVTIGAGGAQVAGVSTVTTGTNGNIGGNTTFGSLVTGYGGGGGCGGTASAIKGGSGAGTAGAGVSSTGTTNLQGGAPSVAFSANDAAAGGGGSTSTVAPGRAEYGGGGAGGGGTLLGGVAAVGAGSMWGGRGGGGGGGFDASNITLGAPGAGGGVGYVAGGGGAGGTTNTGGAAGTAGTAGSAPTGVQISGTGGGGGGGGGGTGAGAGAGGGAGAKGSGGGGGGASTGNGNLSGFGAAGGDGYLQVITFF
jgi:hypothetical protein